MVTGTASSKMNSSTPRIISGGSCGMVVEVLSVVTVSMVDVIGSVMSGSLVATQSINNSITITLELHKFSGCKRGSQVADCLLS